jgi:hypothetical protein
MRVAEPQARWLSEAGMAENPLPAGGSGGSAARLTRPLNSDD